MRYGYVQGINAAAEEMGITDKVTIEYAYGGQFYGSTEITAAMDTWYSNETEVVFACGGGIFMSKNYVGLPEDTTQWNKNFGVNDYQHISLLILAVSSKKSRAPKAEGIPYDKGQR